MDHPKRRIIKVATFNMFNLVLPDVTYYENKRYSKDEYNKKLDWITYILNQMNADIIGVQEIFHKEALIEAAERAGYKNCKVIAADPTGEFPVVGLISRFPVIDYELIEEFPSDSLLDVVKEETGELIVLPFRKFSRKILKATVKLPTGYEMQVFVTHLKSKRPDFLDNENRENHTHLAKAKIRSLMRRAAEATALRSIMLKTLENTEIPVIAMGDVNDTGLSVTTRVLSGEPPMRKLPQDVKRKIWDVLLYHVKDIQARRSFDDFYYTHIHNGHYESLDHIMVSQELVPEYPRNIGKVGYVSLYNDHLIDETQTDEKIPKWKSDHGIVCVTIELNFNNNVEQTN